MSCAPVGELMESDRPPMSTKGATPASASGAVGESMTPVPAHREPDGALDGSVRGRRGHASDGDSETPTRPRGPMKPAPGGRRDAAVQGDRRSTEDSAASTT